MNKQKIGVDFSLRFENIVDLNPSFAAARVAIAYPGRNRNRSDISKETFEKALPSLKNVPLVGRYDEDKDDFGSHDIKVKKNGDGNYVIVNATVPFGVVPESSNTEWQMVTEEDGTQREYLFCDVILWKRQNGYERLAQKNTWHQSMEIGVNRYTVDKDGYCVIEDMDFEALCILSDTVEPCFESASVQMNTTTAVANYKSQFSEMLSELKAFAAECPEQFGLNIKHEEGNNTLTEEMKNQILGEYGFSMDDLNFEIRDDMDEAAFRAELDKMKADTQDSGTQSFSATYRQKREALSNALDAEVVKDSAGNVVSETCYWVYDFDDTYVFVEKDTWTASDYKSKHGRMTYVFDEATLTATITGEFEEMVQQWLTLEENEKLQQSRNAFELLSEEFEAYKASHQTSDEDVTALREFQNKAVQMGHQAEIDAVLDEFAEKLGKNEEFVALTENGNEKAYAYETAEELRKECYMIAGKASVGTFSKKPAATVRIPVGENIHTGNEGRYGDLFEKYGK